MLSIYKNKFISLKELVSKKLITNKHYSVIFSNNILNFILLKNVPFKNIKAFSTFKYKKNKFYSKRRSNYFPKRRKFKVRPLINKNLKFIKLSRKSFIIDSKYARNILWFLTYMGSPSVFSLSTKLNLTYDIYNNYFKAKKFEARIKQSNYILHSKLVNPRLMFSNFSRRTLNIYKLFQRLSRTEKIATTALLSQLFYSKNIIINSTTPYVTRFMNYLLKKNMHRRGLIKKINTITFRKVIFRKQNDSKHFKKKFKFFFKKRKFFFRSLIFLKYFSYIKKYRVLNKVIKFKLRKNKKQIKNKRIVFSTILLRKNCYYFLRQKSKIALKKKPKKALKKLRIFLLKKNKFAFTRTKIKMLAKFYFWFNSLNLVNLQNKINKLTKNKLMSASRIFFRYKIKYNYKILNPFYKKYKYKFFNKHKKHYKFVRTYFNLFLISRRNRLCNSSFISLQTARLKKKQYKQLIFLKYFLTNPSYYFYKYIKNNLFNNFKLNLLSKSASQNYSMYSKNQLSKFYSKKILYPIFKHLLPPDLLNKRLRIYNLATRILMIKKVISNSLFLSSHKQTFIPFRFFSFKLNLSRTNFLRLQELTEQQKYFSRSLNQKIYNSRNYLWSKNFKETKLSKKKHSAVRFARDTLTKNVFRRKDSFRILHIFRTIFLKYFFNIKGLNFFQLLHNLKKNKVHNLSSINFVNKFLWSLESTVSTLVCRSKFISSIKISSHLVRYGFVLCNNSVTVNPYTKINLFDIVFIGKKNLLLRLLKFENALMKGFRSRNSIPDYIEVNSRVLSCTVFKYPSLLDFISFSAFVINYNNKFLYKLLPALACMF